MARLPYPDNGREAAPICGDECLHRHDCVYYPMCDRILHDQLSDILDAIREDAKGGIMRRRLIRPGDTYRDGDDVELEEIPPRDNPPPPELQGEPWEWTKPGEKPRGWREDGRYDSD